MSDMHHGDRFVKAAYPACPGCAVVGHDVYQREVRLEGVAPWISFSCERCWSMAGSAPDARIMVRWIQPRSAGTWQMPAPQTAVNHTLSRYETFIPRDGSCPNCGSFDGTMRGDVRCCRRCPNEFLPGHAGVAQRALEQSTAPNACATPLIVATTARETGQSKAEIAYSDPRIGNNPWPKPQSFAPGEYCWSCGVSRVEAHGTLRICRTCDRRWHTYGTSGPSIDVGMPAPAPTYKVTVADAGPSLAECKRKFDDVKTWGATPPVRSDVDPTLLAECMASIERLLAAPLPRDITITEMRAKLLMPPPPIDPLDVETEGVKLRMLIARNAANSQEAGVPCFLLTHAQRAAVSAHWSAELRLRVAAGKQADMARVVVDQEEE